MIIRRLVCALFALAAGIAAAAGQYPDKPVRIVVPYPPGGGTDILARTLGQKLADKWGQTAVIDNRGGATGMIGTEIVKNAVPDGYSLLFSASQEIVINPNLYKNLRYNSLKDFTPVTLVARTPNIFVAHPSLPAANFRDFIALAKQRPGQISYASTGIGSSQHVAGEVLKFEARIDLIHVPYRGGGPQVTDLLGGQTPCGFVALPAAIQFVRQGRLKAFGVTASSRSPTLPDVPTMAEAGLPGNDVDQWYGLFLPAAAPPGLVNALNADFVRAIRAPEIRSRMIDLGYEPAGNTSSEFANFVREQMARYYKIINDTGIRIE